MITNFRRFPNIVHGLVALGGVRLREIAERAGLSLKGVPAAPGALAGALRDRLASPDILRQHLNADDLDRIGKRFGFEARASWQADQALGFDEAVLARLFEEAELPVRPASRPSRRDPAHAANWPELSNLAAWAALSDAGRDSLVRALALSSGPQVSPAGFVGPQRLARIYDEVAGCTFVAIPGGDFDMGLSEGERRSLARLVKHWGAEERDHLADMTSNTRPVHEVKIPPFLCAEAPLQSKQQTKFSAQVQDSHNPHQVCLFSAGEADKVVAELMARLLSEAEWEFVARAGGTRTWLSGDLEPRAYTAQVLGGDLPADNTHPFGLHGLGWGSWVEDGWHASYQGAPVDGTAWEPRQLPEVARGGALLSWPWQMAGEALLLHAAQRERVQQAAFPLLLGRDLPRRQI